MNKLLNRRLADVEEILIRKFNQFAVEYGAKHILTLGEPNFDTPDAMKMPAIQALGDGKTYYGSSYGNQNFREAVQRFEKRVNQVDYDLNEIMITHGSTEGLAAALITMLNPGDEVINLTPAYPLYKNVVALTGAKIVSVDVSKNNFQVSKEMLDAAITNRTKVIIITSPNNPTGTILNDESLAVIYQAVKKHKFFVISDEVYNQLVYTERRLGFSKYQDIRDYIVVCQSLSKPYAMTGWRLGYMLAPLWFMESVLKIHQYLVVAVNTFIQDGGVAALEYDVTPMVESYRARRDYVVMRLQAMDVKFPYPEGAFYVFISVAEFGMDSWRFCEELVRAEGVALIPGICFDTDDHVRISYCVEMDTLIAGMEGLERFVTGLRVKKMNSGEFKEGDVVEGRITGVQSYGIFVRLSDQCSGLVHASELEKLESREPSRFFKLGQTIKVRIIRAKPGGTQFILKIYRERGSSRRIGAANFETTAGFDALQDKIPEWVQYAKDKNWI